MMQNKKLVVLLSGNGSTLQSLIDREAAGPWGAEIVGVISNKPDAYGLKRAEQAKIPNQIINHRNYKTKAEFEAELLKAIETYKPDLILLAGFMRILSPAFSHHFAKKLLNIHPSLLPAYKGLNTHARVLANRESWHGSSIHWVSPELDAGPLLAQSRLPVFNTDTLDSISKRVHQAEHYLYPRLIEALACGRIQSIEQRNSDLETYDPETGFFTKLYYSNF
jgi:phosphoribosylglycinamide formyltransferase-1